MGVTMTTPVKNSTSPHIPVSERERLIVENMPLVRALARRYANRGEPVDDLEQAGAIGLIKAVDRFDHNRPETFRAFAATTILGEIRRHFRDKTWAVRVPRGLKDDYAQVSAAINALTPQFGHSPSVGEIADYTGIAEERVLDAIEAHAAYRPKSLSESPIEGEDDATPLEIADTEHGYELVEGREALRRGLAVLPDRERVIVHLRFEEGLIQSEIGKIMGISQMHVSRLLSRALETLRRVAHEGESAA
jgi:RNA polymerase sigma-B factor